MYSLRTIALAASFLGLVACSQTTESDADAVSGDEAALVGSACSREAIGQAFTHYKAAIAAAKRHAEDACMDDKSDLTVITKEAAAATASCGAFSALIEWSPEAAPIRKELAGNLALAQLTGDLEVKDAAGNHVYQGLTTSLEKGVTLWGPAPGVYGNMMKLEFAANGKLKAYSLKIDNDGAPTWRSTEGTYRVGNVDGDTVMITVTANGLSIDYDLKATSEGNVPDFELAPIGEAPPEVFRAYVSECEA